MIFNNESTSHLTHDQIICAIQHHYDYLSKWHTTISNDLFKLNAEKNYGIQDETYDEDFSKLKLQQYMLTQIQDEFSELFDSIIIKRSL